jgi:serine protease AprX
MDPIKTMFKKTSRPGLSQQEQPRQPWLRGLLGLGLISLLSSQALAAPLVRLQQTTFDPQSTLGQFETSFKTRTWIVSFGQPITEAMKADLVRLGFEILGFVPDSSLLVRVATGRELTSVADQEPMIAKAQSELGVGVFWTPFQPAWKWAKSLPAPSVFNQLSRRVVFIRCHSKADAQSLNQILEKKEKVMILNSQDESIVVRATSSDLFSISALDEVAYLSDVPDFQLMHMNFGFEVEPQAIRSDITGFETGTKVMNMDFAWGQGFMGRGQIVAMGDTGLDRGDLQNIHPDFNGAVVSGRNFAPFGRSWEDPMGHGTHVAGSVVSRGTASNGAFKGGAYEAGFVVHSLWSPMMNNLMLPNKLGDMFSAATASGASVHTNSWGQARNFGTYDSFARQVDEYMFNNPGLLILFAAGNSGVDMDKDGRIDADSIGSPGTAKNALTVGASENLELKGGIQRPVSDLRPAKDFWSAEPIWSSKISDNPQGLAMFSSRGPTDDGRIKPEIVAPGTNILSTFSKHPKAEVLWGKYNEDYVWSGGTSMATPLVAGAAAVTRQILQTRFKVSSPSSSLLKAFMLNFATDLYPGQYGEVGASRGQELLTLRPNSDEGFGLVNMKSQVEALPDNTMVIDAVAGVATGETQDVNFTMARDGVLTVTLVWNDAPGLETAARALVNDLNFEILGPGVQYSSTDGVNNFEFFEKNARAGQYRVRVKGAQVPQGRSGKQPYSLVIRGR